MATTKPPRLIDSLPTPTRTKPMQVLVLSPARSGTTSVEAALTQLGYNVYKGMKHAFLHASRGENTYPEWSEALDAVYPLSTTPNTRYGITTLYTTTDFEKILAPYTAAVGWPLSLFPSAALTAYPTAKIILMTRDPRSWSDSMLRTLCPRLTWRSWSWLLPLENGIVRDCIECGQRCLNAWTDGEPWSREKLEGRYVEHNALVRRLCEERGREVLVYDVKEGWGPLCEFLGVEVPPTAERPFPREAEGGKFEKQGRMFWYMALAKVVGKGLGLSMVCGVAYLALKYLRRARR